MDSGDDFFTGGGDPAPAMTDGQDQANDGGYDAFDQQQGTYENAPMEGQYAEMDQQQQQGGGGGMTSYEEQPQTYEAVEQPQQNGMTNGMAMSAPAKSDALDAFNAQWADTLREKARKEAQLAVEAEEAATNDLKKFKSDREMKQEAKMSQNRAQEQVFLEQLEADLESDNPWERVVSLVNTQAEQAATIFDTGRMRSIFIQLKNEPILREPASASS